MYISIIGIVGMILCLIFFRPKKTWMRLLIIAGGLTTVLMLALIPVEDFFNKIYSTPEAAFDRKYDYDGDIILNIEGKNTNFIIAECEGSFSVDALFRNELGWKKGSVFDTKHYHIQFEEGFIILIHRYKQTSDFYIWIQDTEGVIKQISDSCGSVFWSYSGNSPSFETVDTIYAAHIKDFNSEYALFINDGEYFLNAYKE